ncbi:hypothetical protein EQV77_02220 [Halobacillus fulvus]|nr:hypothetical protein EQV77_02220 [Halobacillus fulvus]
MLVLRQDGFGGYAYFPENGEIHLVCTCLLNGHRFIILHYIDLPFRYRRVNSNGICLLEKQLYYELLPYMDDVDLGRYDDQDLACHIHTLMKD